MRKNKLVLRPQNILVRHFRVAHTSYIEQFWLNDFYKRDYHIASRLSTFCYFFIYHTKRKLDFVMEE